MNNRLSEIVKSILIKNEIDLFSLVVDGWHDCPFFAGADPLSAEYVPPAALCEIPLCSTGSGGLYTGC